MSLTDYTFRLGDAGEVLNEEVSTTFVDITRVIGLDSAQARQTERDWEGNDGGFMDAEFEKGRTVLLQGLVYATHETLEAYLDDLKENWALSRELVPLYFQAPGVVERLVFVKPLGCRYDWDDTRRLAKASIEFTAFAEDPRIYSSELIELPVAINSTSTTGFGFNLSFPFSFGTASAGMGTNAINLGNRPAPFTAIIPGPTVNPRLINDDTGDEMEFSITLLADEYLEVNTLYKTVRLDGTTNRRNTMVSPSWFHLQKGDNHIRYLADVVTSSSMTIKYRHAWR